MCVCVCVCVQHINNKFPNNWQTIKPIISWWLRNNDMFIEL